MRLVACDVARLMLICPGMKTTIIARLSLSRETLRRLDARALDAVAGGARKTKDVTITCVSVDICPSLDVCPSEDCPPPILS